MTPHERAGIQIWQRVSMKNTAHSDGLMGTVTRLYPDGVGLDVHIDGDKAPSFWGVHQVARVGCTPHDLWRTEALARDLFGDHGERR